MKRQIELITRRLEVFNRDVVAPSVYSDAVPLEVGAHQSETPIPFAEARGREFTPVTTGWRWGPVWSTCWFRLRGSLPTAYAGRPVVLRFSSGTEALLWDVQRGPIQGFDVNRDTAYVYGVVAGEPAPARPGAVEFYVEAACNHPFGISCFEWDPADHHKRWKGPTPGELERAELAVLNVNVWSLHRALVFGIDLMRQLPAESERVQQLARELMRAVEAVDDQHVAETALDGLGIAIHAISTDVGSSTPECVAVGHAHIDTAWLWPLRETRRKCLRTFSNVLGLMDRFESFNFLCSQAQQYAYVEEDSPELFARIKARVAEGRWEPGGAMWIEPDANCPSGESLLRQCLHAHTYWTDHFGERAAQRFLYLPDTFGFPASLPGIMRHAGLDTFITNKMWWSQFNEFPHTTFRWRGVDGSEVLAHNTPGGDYNALLTPRELRKGLERCERTGGQGLYLQPFGFGDGGGGPTDTTIYHGELAEQCEGLPRVRAGRVDEFCGLLHERRDRELDLGRDLPLWWGELYLELHRGTLTSQGRTKQNNRRCEELLRLAELATFAAPPGAAIDAEKQAAARRKLDQAWKKLLLNQFHDILPGSSIGWVYKDAEQDYAFIRRTAEQLIEKGLKAWSGVLALADAIEPLMVVNPGSVERSGIVEFPADAAGGERGKTDLKFVRGIPAMGARVVELHASSGCVPVTVEASAMGVTLSNGVIEVVIDDCGRILSLGRIGSLRDACRQTPVEDGGEEQAVEFTPINHLVMYEDRPHMWDAWDLDPGYERKPTWTNDQPATVEVVMQHPLRAEVRVTHKVGASTISQTFRLDAGSPRVDVINDVDWHESHRILRAIFPVDVMAEVASYDVQFGVVQRPTHANTSWDAAKMENCAHRWVDASEPGFGIALLSDSKYGFSCVADEASPEGGCGVVLGISLLRSPTHPDPDADRGAHRFTYALLPHEGDWRAAGVDLQAEALNMPLIGARAGSPTGGVTPGMRDAWTPFVIRTEGACGVQVHAIKPAEDGSGAMIVRLAECRGGKGTAVIDWNVKVSAVTAVDALERAEQEHVATDLEHAGGTTTLHLRAFEIVSLRVER
jgi:alpha-mannosidase